MNVALLSALQELERPINIPEQPGQVANAKIIGLVLMYQAQERDHDNADAFF